MDYFRDTLYEVSRRLPGELHDQLMGLVYTRSEHEVIVGALMLMPWEKVGPAKIIELVENLNKIESEEKRRKYVDLLPSVVKFQDMYGQEADFIQYGKYLNKVFGINSRDQQIQN